MYGILNPGDVVLADALFDDYFPICELRDRGIDLVARAQYERVGTQTLQSRSDGEILVWRPPESDTSRGQTAAESSEMVLS